MAIAHQCVPSEQSARSPIGGQKRPGLTSQVLLLKTCVILENQTLFVFLICWTRATLKCNPLRYSEFHSVLLMGENKGAPAGFIQIPFDFSLYFNQNKKLQKPTLHASSQNDIYLHPEWQLMPSARCACRSSPVVVTTPFKSHADLPGRGART